MAARLRGLFTLHAEKPSTSQLPIQTRDGPGGAAVAGLRRPSRGAGQSAACGVGRRLEAAGGRRHQSRPAHRRGQLGGPRRAGGDCARPIGRGLDLQRRRPRAADSCAGWRSPHRAFCQQAARADDGPLARGARPDSDGWRAGHLAARSAAWRIVHLRFRRPGRRPLLVPPARDVGRAGGVWTLRRAARRGSERTRWCA